MLALRIPGLLVAALLAGGLLSAQITNCLNLPTPPTKGLPVGLQFPAIDSDLPFDVTFATKTLENDQKAFDLFSWDTFVALNWPADKTGKPLPGKIGDNPTALRVWEKFLASAQVMKKDGVAPDPWGGENRFAFLGEKLVNRKAGQRVLFAGRQNVLGDVLQAGFNTSKFPPIADTNGMYVFYEQYINKVEYDYIVSNKLYYQDGQTAFLKSGKAVDFPKGSAGGKKGGAIEIKVMWMQLGKGHDRAKFYTIDAIRVDPLTSTPSPKPVPFGLVGMHIATRTETAKEWVWSTFEHVDNAPDVGETMLKARYNFNDPTKPQPTSGFGFRPPTNKAVANPTTPTQITRVVLSNNLLSAPWTRTLNETVQAKLAGTVWANYRLVSTQWPSPTGQPIPCKLTNTVAETYQQASGSCMLCHASAQTAGKKPDGQKGSANFSYLLQMAQPSVKAAPGGP